MKKFICPMCGKKNIEAWPCTKHERKPGMIHSGMGAVVDCEWECPNCEGKGYLLLSIVDQVLLYFARRMNVLRKTVDYAR